MLYLNSLQFLIFSSQKTANNTLMETLNHHGYKSVFCHGIFNFQFWKMDINNDNFLQKLIRYKDEHGKKLQVITVLRNPFERHVSTFFQTYYDEQVEFNNVLPSDTIIMTNDVDSLCNSVIELLDYVPIHESIWELSEYFGEDILAKMTKKDNHYRYENEYIDLFILDFETILEHTYLNSCLQIQTTELISGNLTSSKIYSEKFREVKKRLLRDDRYISKIRTLYKDKDVNKNQEGQEGQNIRFFEFMRLDL